MMNSICFDKFLGVDFSCDPAMVDSRRSPDAVNMIPNAAGHPEKRVGYREIQTYPQRINGIFTYNEEILVHSGDKIYRDDTPLISNITDGKSTSCIFCDKLWILTGGDFLVYDGESLNHVREVATVPQVISQADNHLEHGMTYQPFNMLVRTRCVGIAIPDEGVNVISINQNVDPATVKLYFKGGKEIRPKNTYFTSDGSTYCMDLPETYHSKGVGDEIMVEYTTSDEYVPIIEKCTFITTYDNRIFLGGNPDYPNTDFYSELFDGTYFSDLSYTNIGTWDEKREDSITSNEKILGYSKIGDHLAIHTKSDEATIYLRSRNMNEEGAYYPIVAGISGEECITNACNCTFLSDPLFLTPSGIFAIGSENITQEKSIRSRSSRINPRLTAEPNLKDAISAVWQGFYMVFINGRVYLADSRGRSYVRNVTGDFEYEWYYFENVPARAVCVDGDVLYFGDNEGKLYRFNNDMKDADGEYLSTAFSDNGEAIYARWATKMEDGGDFNALKLITRRGSGVYVKTYKKGGFVRVKIRTEKDFGVEANAEENRRFSFEDMDFTDFTFNTLPFSFLPFNKKVKDCRMMQIIIENDKVNSGMGVVSIRWHYKKGGFAK
ncbi:MAG: hypothetical protein IKU25_03265 [Clostridia bacterium]|nr:hypothetical protein [Clostridia bacterium]